MASKRNMLYMYTIDLTGRIHNIIYLDTIETMEKQKEYVGTGADMGRIDNYKVKDKFIKYLSQTPSDPVSGSGMFGENSNRKMIVPYNPPRRRRY